MKWYRQHKHFDWFGSSAIVCLPEFMTESFIPVQRILSVCIYGKLTIAFQSNQSEKVIVASPTH